MRHGPWLAPPCWWLQLAKLEKVEEVIYAPAGVLGINEKVIKLGR